MSDIKPPETKPPETKPPETKPPETTIAKPQPKPKLTKDGTIAFDVNDKRLPHPESK